MSWYKLKTAKNKKKIEFSCIEWWDYEEGVSNISIAMKRKDIELVIYCINEREFMLYNFSYDKDLYEFEDYTNDMFRVLTHITKYDIPKTVVNKFLNKVNGLRNG